MGWNTSKKCCHIRDKIVPSSEQTIQTNQANVKDLIHNSNNANNLYFLIIQTLTTHSSELWLPFFLNLSHILLN